MSTGARNKRCLPYFRVPKEVDLDEHADLSLHFGDGTCLKAHSHLLKLASPVFRRMIEDLGREVASLTLEDDPSVWRVILFSMHPLGAPHFAMQLGYSEHSINDLDSVVALARKYELGATLTWVDQCVAGWIADKRLKCLNSASKIGLKDPFVSDGKFLQTLNWTARSGLDSSFEACLEFFDRLSMNPRYRNHSSPHGAGPGSEITTAARNLLRDGFIDAGVCILDEMLCRLTFD